MTEAITFNQDTFNNCFLGSFYVYKDYIKIKIKGLFTCIISGNNFDVFFLTAE